MAETMQFDLVSPERSLASFAADAVQIPGAEGNLTAMPGHLPVIVSLRPGVVRAQSGAEAKDFYVTSGFVEITATSVSVIAERAHEGETVTKDDLKHVIEEARADAETAPAERKAVAEKFLADLVHLLEDME
ncbi:MAG: F0F1 ATP synthase subunit epsilon [Marinibacterium sp.]|nr:F0F1 ATP synthase subunit epsilon [Marinibacterium sp.]